MVLDPITFRPKEVELLIALEKDAEKQDRSRNYLINKILMDHYELTEIKSVVC